MGPNSGGGKKNKDNNNPAIGGARNRFSKWKPPTKDLKDKFSKQHEKRAVEHEATASTVNAKQASHLAVGNKGRQSGEKGSQPTALATSGEMLAIHATVVNELLRIFQVEAAPVQGNITVSREKAPPSGVSEKEVMVHHLSSKPPPPPPAKSGKPSSDGADTLQARQQRSRLINYGFELDEITSAIQNASATSDENALVLQALAAVSKQNRPASGTGNSQSLHLADLSFNEDLMSELEVLSSIYMEHVCYRSVALNGHVACIIDVCIPLEEDLLKSALKQQKPAGKAAGQEVVHVRVFIPVVSTYPRAASLMYGWILPSDFESEVGAVKSAGKTAPSTTALLPTSIARQLSLQAMSHIHAYQFQFETPAVFEFLQHIRENLAPALGAHYAAHPTNVVGAPAETKSAQGLSENKNKQNNKKNTASKAPVELPTPEVVGPPPMPPRPTTSIMQTIEYRTALSGAFSASLVGEAARAKAHAELEFILPKVKYLQNVVVLSPSSIE